MLLQNIRLRELTQAVPVCSHTAALITALELFSHSQNTRLVIVDDQQHPTGLVNLQRLFPCLVQAQSSVDAIAPDTEITLHTSLQAITPAIIEPLVVVPDEWQVRYFLSNLNPQSQFNYAVVDREGRFLGLLDTDCLLQALADSLAESLSDPGLNTHPSTAMTAQSPEPIQLSIARSQENLVLSSPSSNVKLFNSPSSSWPRGLNWNNASRPSRRRLTISECVKMLCCNQSC